MQRKPKKLKVLLVGGGSGGHMYPLIAVAREISKRTISSGMNPDMRYFGDAGPFREYLHIAGIRTVSVASSKWRRYFSLLNVLDFFKFFFGFFQALWKVYWFMPHICFSKGGPGALPIIAAARFYAIPVVIHESDAVAGLTNRFSARSARIIELAFTNAESGFPGNIQKHLVGNPMREEIQKTVSPDDAKREFRLANDVPVILILGGSQGAERINTFVLERIPELIKEFQVLHQVGVQNFQSYKNEFEFLYGKAAQDITNRYKFFPYFNENLPNAYAASDIVISRAGASAIFETAYFGKPAMLIPIPESANNHQVENAYAYEAFGAAMVIEEKNFLPSLVINELKAIVADKTRRETMSERARAFAKPNAAAEIARDIMGVLRV